VVEEQAERALKKKRYPKSSKPDTRAAMCFLKPVYHFQCNGYHKRWHCNDKVHCPLLPHVVARELAGIETQPECVSRLDELNLKVLALKLYSLLFFAGLFIYVLTTYKVMQRWECMWATRAWNEGFFTEEFIGLVRTCMAIRGLA
jgi:hypothetical protein